MIETISALNKAGVPWEMETPDILISEDSKEVVEKLFPRTVLEAKGNRYLIRYDLPPSVEVEVVEVNQKVQKPARH